MSACLAEHYRDLTILLSLPMFASCDCPCLPAVCVFKAPDSARWLGQRFQGKLRRTEDPNKDSKGRAHGQQIERRMGAS